MDADPLELTQALEEANAKADSNPALSNIISGLRDKIGGFRGFVKNQASVAQYGKDMMRAMEYSQWARRACIEIDQGKRTPQEFKTAKAVAERGITLLREVIAQYPKAAEAILPMMGKMERQVKQIDDAIRTRGVV